MTSTDTDVQINSLAKRPMTNGHILQLIHPEFLSRKLELNSSQLATPMIRGNGNVLFSTHSVKLLMGRITWLLSTNLWRM